MSAKPAPALATPTVQRAAPSLFWTTSACILAADFVALALVYWIAVIGRYLFKPEYQLSFYLELFPVVGLFLGAFFLQGLYPGLLLHPAEEIRHVFYGATTVCLLITCSTFFWRNGEAYSRSIFLLVWISGIPMVLLARYLMRRSCSERPWWGIPAVVLGTAASTKRVIYMLRKTHSHLRVTGVLTEDQAHIWTPELPPILGRMSMAPFLAQNRTAQYAIVALPQHPTTELHDLIEDCCRGFSQVLLVPDLPGICSLGVSARDIGGELGFEFPQRLFQRSAAIVKRASDILMSAAALLLLSVLFLVVTICVKCSSPGPIFFGHDRYGRDGQVFKAVKFRTMVQNGDQVLDDYLRAYPEHLAEWQRDHKLKNDPRVTRVGRWLRRYSIDELPQLWNVLKGDMSLVGPRPIVKDEIRKYGRGYGLFVRVRPGMTGLWQVSGRNNTSYAERVGFDVYYVRNWSIWLDLYILLRTVRVVLTAHGAY